MATDGPLNAQVRIGLDLLMERVGPRELGHRWRIEWGDGREEIDPWVSVELVIGERSLGRWAIWKRTGDVYEWPRTGPEDVEPVGDDPIVRVDA